MRVSILDIQAPTDLPEVVAVAEHAGYHRYWVSEHHTPLQSASPTVATAIAAGVSDRLRVGMGGVLLRLHAPMRVAADIALLRAFFPGRIDLGIAGAPGGADAALHFGGIADDADYRGRIAELIRLVTTPNAAPGSAFVDDAPLQLWLCGASADSARLAGELGMSYAYHHYLARPAVEPRADIGTVYRDAFRPGAAGAAPYFAIAGFGAVGGDEVEARQRWLAYRSSADRARPRSEPSFSGSPAGAAVQIAELVASYGADEILVDCFAGNLDDRLDGLRRLAEGLGLAAVTQRADDGGD